MGFITTADRDWKRLEEMVHRAAGQYANQGRSSCITERKSVMETRFFCPASRFHALRVANPVGRLHP